jgi:peptide/nickel transport system substrate-binding protein
VFFKYHSEGAQSVLADPELDALIEQATVTTGDERQKTWQEVFRRVHEDHVADIMMFHMVGYTRVGPRVDFTPDISTNSELQVAKVKFKE